MNVLWYVRRYFIPITSMNGQLPFFCQFKWHQQLGTVTNWRNFIFHNITKFYHKKYRHEKKNTIKKSIFLHWHGNMHQSTPLDRIICWNYKCYSHSKTIELYKVSVQIQLIIGSVLISVKPVFFNIAYRLQFEDFVSHFKNAFGHTNLNFMDPHQIGKICQA